MELAGTPGLPPVLFLFTGCWHWQEYWIFQHGHLGLFHTICCQATEKLGNYHRKDASLLNTRHKVILSPLSHICVSIYSFQVSNLIINTPLSTSTPTESLSVLKVMWKLISKQFKFPGQISFSPMMGGDVMAGRGVGNDWLQMVRSGSIAISVRYMCGQHTHIHHTRSWEERTETSNIVSFINPKHCCDGFYIHPISADLYKFLLSQDVCKKISKQ